MATMCWAAPNFKIKLPTHSVGESRRGSRDDRGSAKRWIHRTCSTVLDDRKPWSVPYYSNAAADEITDLHIFRSKPATHTRILQVSKQFMGELAIGR